MFKEIIFHIDFHLLFIVLIVEKKDLQSQLSSVELL